MQCFLVACGYILELQSDPERLYLGFIGFKGLYSERERERVVSILKYCGAEL